jgi:hypothetical protein
MPFIGRRREERQCHGGEMVGGKWSSSMLPFRGEDRKGSTRFRRGKEHAGRLLVPVRRGDWRMQRHGGARQPKSSGVCIDPRWKTSSWAERLFGSDTVVEIKHAVKMEWAGKERFLGRKKIMKKNLGYCSLNKNNSNF